MTVIGDQSSVNGSTESFGSEQCGELTAEPLRAELLAEVSAEPLSVIGVSENYLLLITGYRLLITNSYRLSFDIFWKFVIASLLLL